jgi:hypothetical protein
MNDISIIRQTFWKLFKKRFAQRQSSHFYEGDTMNGSFEKLNRSTEFFLGSVPKTFFSRPVFGILFPFLFLFSFTAVPSEVQATSPQLKISGNQIINASSGCTVRLKGVDVSGLEYSPTGDGGTGRPTTTINGVIMTDYVSIITEAVNVWHCNIVRFPVNQDYWFGCTNSHASSVNQVAYQGMVQAVANYCSQNNVYLDLDLHWSGYYTGTSSTTPCTGAGWGESGGTCASCSGQAPMPDWNAAAFWSSVAGTSWIQNNPAVLFDLFNEPFDPSGKSGPTDAFWTTWRNGGAVAASNNGSSSFPAYNTPGMQQLLTSVRGAGANNIVVAGGLNWAFDLTGLPANDLTDTASGNGVLYSSHVYSSKGFPAGGTQWDTSITDATATSPPHAVIIEEFGATSTDGAAWDTSTINWINGTNDHNYVFSAMAWAFSSDVGPTLLTSFSGYPTTSYHGAPVSTWLTQLNQTPTPNCSGGGNTPTFTFTPTKTDTPTFTFTPSFTFTPTATRTNSSTSTATATATPSSTATLSFTPTATRTNTPMNTPSSTSTKTNTFTNTSTATASSTPSGTATPTLSFTSSATPSSTPTSSFTPTATRTNTPLNTPTSTSTSTYSPTPTSTYSSTASATPTNTLVNTATPTSTATRTASATATNTLVNTGTPTSTPTVTYTKTNSPSNTPSATNTFSATASPTQTGTFTLSPTGTLSPSPTPTVTSTPSATSTHSDTPTFSSTGTPSATSTASFTSTTTPTQTPTITGTPTTTPSNTPLATPSPTSSSTATHSFTPSLTPTSTATDSMTPTPTKTNSSTVTSTPILSPTGTVPPTDTPTNTPTATSSGTPSSTATSSMTATPSLTASRTASSTSTPTGTSTHTKTATSTLSFTSTLTPTSTAFITRTPAPSGNPPAIYPNPSNGGPVTLNPGLTAPSDVRVDIFTVGFRKVNSLFFPSVPAGATVSLNLTDRFGTPLASGLYYLVLHTSQGRTILKLLILR